MPSTRLIRSSTSAAGPVQLDDQDGFDVERIAGVDEILAGPGGQLVHHFHAAGNNPAADDRGHAVAGRLVAGKADQQGARRFRFLQNANGDFRYDTKQTFRAGGQTEQVVALGVEVAAAETDDLAVHQNHLDAEQVVGGEAVFQAMDAAGVLGDVAADRTGNLARRIGRVIETLVLDGLGQAQVGDPGLGDDAAVLPVDLQDFVELAHGQGNAVCDRQGPAGQRGAGPARHHFDAGFVAVLQNFRHLLDGFGQDHDQRQLAVGRQTVAFVDAQCILVDDDAVAGHDPAHGGDDLVAAGYDGLIRIGHSHDGRSLAFGCIASSGAEHSMSGDARSRVRAAGTPRCEKKRWVGAYEGCGQGRFCVMLCGNSITGPVPRGLYTGEPS